jgi:hypothetical protein
MDTINNFALPDILSGITPLQIVGVVLVALFLFKKLIKWAIILGALFIVVIPYLNDNGIIDQLKTQLGI